MLTDEEAAELAALRARAYGADADLGDDPRGLSRLDVLEKKAREDDGAPTDAAVDAAAAGEAFEAAVATDAADPVDAVLEAGPAGVPRPIRRTWSRRAVLGIGIPAVLLSVGLGAGIGAFVAAQPGVPVPQTTLPAQYVAGWQTVSDQYDWDAGSPRLLADIQGTLVWGGETTGRMTCVIVEDRGRRSSACTATAALTASGTGIVITDEGSGVSRTYVAWPNGAPIVTYSTDAGKAGHLYDCPACTGSVPNPTVTIPTPETTGG